MEKIALIKLLQSELAIEMAETVSDSELHAQLSTHINTLIKNDFEKLVSYLYRIDVSEEKLKLLLKQNPGEDASDIIATLIIERQQQKIKSRRRFSQRDNHTDTEEKW